jgi:hypothetical protein
VPLNPQGFSGLFILKKTHPFWGEFFIYFLFIFFLYLTKHKNLWFENHENTDDDHQNTPDEM